MPLGLGRPSPPCAKHASSGGMPRIQPADTTGILQLSPDSRPPSPRASFPAKLRRNTQHMESGLGSNLDYCI